MFNTHKAVEIKRMDPRAIIPEYKTAGAAAMDLVACINQPVYIYAGDGPTMIPTGIAIWMRDPNLCSMVLPRSGTGIKGLWLGNSTGLVDADYQGEMMIAALNRNNPVRQYGGTRPDPITINPGDRIAQLVFLPVVRVSLDLVSEFSDVTARGGGGFGSTGIAA